MNNNLIHKVLALESLGGCANLLQYILLYIYYLVNSKSRIESILMLNVYQCN